jgi:hypothetical protein
MTAAELMKAREAAGRAGGLAGQGYAGVCPRCAGGRRCAFETAGAAFDFGASPAAPPAARVLDPLAVDDGDVKARGRATWRRTRPPSA